jgi:tetratricopeptide (TPR) repeat protein
MKKFLLFFASHLFLTLISYSQIPQTSSQNYALIIGISKYQNIISLKYADDDAYLFSKYLIDEEICKKNNIALLVDSNATKGNIYKELYKIKDKIKSGDRVFIYFAGHGDVENDIESGFLLPYNCESTNYAATGIDISLLERYVNSFINKECRVVLITDACRSGNLSGGIIGANATLSSISKNFKNVTKILSCQPSQLSIEKKYFDGGHGIFTKNLVEGLYGLADKNNDNKITLREIDVYLDTVAFESKQLQIPKIDGDPQSVVSEYQNTLKLAFLKKLNKADNYAYEASREVKLKDTIIQTDKDYLNYLKQIKDDNLIYPENDCAFETLKKIKIKNNDLYESIKYELTAILEDQIQSRINKNLFSELSNNKNEDLLELASVIKKVKVMEEILGENDIRKNEIKALKDLFNAWYHYASFNYSGMNKSIVNLKFADSILPNQAWIKNLIGVIYNRLEKYDSGLLYLKDVVKLTPKWVYAWNNLGWSYLGLKNKDSLAIQSLKIANSIDSLHGITWSNLADGYLQQGKKFEAELALKKGIELDPSSYNAYLKLGYLFRNLNRNREAEDCYNRAFKIDSLNIYILKALAEISYFKKDIYSYKNYIKRALNLKPILTDNLNIIASLYDENGEYKDALNLITKSINIDPTYYASYRIKGEILFSQNKHKEAIVYLNKADSLSDNSNALVNNQLAWAYFKAADTLKAIYFANKAIVLSPNESINYWTLGKIMSYNEQYDLAKDNLIKAIDLDPTNSSYWNDLGYIYKNLGDSLNEVTAFQKAVNYGNNNIDFLLDLGWCYLKNDEIKSVYQVIDSIIKIDTKNQDVLLLLSTVLYYLENYNESIENLIKFIKKEDKDYFAWLLLAKNYSSINNKKEAIIALKKALLLNKNLINQISTSDDFENIKLSKEFKELIILFK